MSQTAESIKHWPQYQCKHVATNAAEAQTGNAENKGRERTLQVREVHAVLEKVIRRALASCVSGAGAGGLLAGGRGRNLNIRLRMAGPWRDAAARQIERMELVEGKRQG